VTVTSEPKAHVADTSSFPGFPAGSGLSVVNRHDFELPAEMFVLCEPKIEPWNPVCPGPLAFVIVVPERAV
jgi:hypothetical protein